MAAITQQSTRKVGMRLTVPGILVTTFVIFLFLAQVLTGTPAAFAGLVSSFTILGYWTVKTLGGPTTLPGLSVTVLLMQHVVVSQIAKVFFLQSAVDRMLVPYPTILIYNLAIFGILCAALLFKYFKIESIRPLFDIEIDQKRLSIYAIVLTIFSIFRFYALQKFGVFEGGGVFVGGFVGPLRQFGFLSSLAVACGTAAVILKTNGRRCLGFWNTVAIIGPILYGILGAGRQDSATSIVTFGLTLFAFRFKLRIAHYVALGLFGYVLQFIIFPYALYARGEGQVRVGSFEERIVKAGNLLAEFTFSPKRKTEELTKNEAIEPWSFQRMHYYGTSNSTLERYSVILTTDNLVNAVIERGPKGQETIFAGFFRILPRFLNPEKEALGTGNTVASYGDGLVNPGDLYTQITMGFVPDSVYAYSWPGAFFVPLIVSFAYFLVYTLLFRPSIFKNVFVVAFMFTSTWTYSEETVAGQTLNIIQTPIYFILAFTPLAIFARTLTKKVREAPYIFEGRISEQALRDRDERLALPEPVLKTP